MDYESGTIDSGDDVWVASWICEEPISDLASTQRVQVLALRRHLRHGNGTKLKDDMIAKVVEDTSERQTDGITVRTMFYAHMYDGTVYATGLVIYTMPLDTEQAGVVQ